MNQVYNNPLIIRNVEFKEYLNEEESLKKINEFRLSDAGKALPDSKRNSLRRIANYFVTHPNFGEVSEDHVLIKEGYPAIFTSKNYKKLKYEKSVKKEEINESSSQLLNGDGDGDEKAKSDLLKKDNSSKPKLRIRDILLAKGIEPETYAPGEDGKMKLVAQESSVKEDSIKSNKLKITTAKKKMPKDQSSVIKHDASKDHDKSNKVVISSPKNKKKNKNKKSINEKSNIIIENDTGLIRKINSDVGLSKKSKKSVFNSVEEGDVKKNEAAKESGLIKDSNNVKKVISSSIKEKKSDNEAAIRTSEKRTFQESDMINVKKVKKAKLDPSNNRIIDKKNNGVSERELIQGTSKVIENTGLIQGTAKVKSDPSKKRKRSKEESEECNVTNAEAIQGTISPKNNISKVKNDKKKGRLKEDKGTSKETIDNKDSASANNAVTINIKKKKKKLKK